MQLCNYIFRSDIQSSGQLWGIEMQLTSYISSWVHHWTVTLGLSMEMQLCNCISRSKSEYQTQNVVAQLHFLCSLLTLGRNIYWGVLCVETDGGQKARREFHMSDTVCGNAYATTKSST